MAGITRAENDELAKELLGLPKDVSLTDAKAELEKVIQAHGEFNTHKVSKSDPQLTGWHKKLVEMKEHDIIIFWKVLHRFSVNNNLGLHL